jgi:hypothetical protein
MAGTGLLQSEMTATTDAQPTVEVETQRAARRITTPGVGHIENDHVFRDIPENIISYFEERAQELGEGLR